MPDERPGPAAGDPVPARPAPGDPVAAPAWRATLFGAIAGFVVVLVVVALGTIVAVKLALGDQDPAEFARRMEEGAVVPTDYLMLNLAASVLGALAGGWTAARVARAPGDRAVRVLAWVLLLMGITSIAIARGAAPGQPEWYPWVMLLVGPFGVLAGGRLAGRRPGIRAPT